MKISKETDASKVKIGELVWHKDCGILLLLEKIDVDVYIRKRVISVNTALEYEPREESIHIHIMTEFIKEDHVNNILNNITLRMAMT